MKASSMWNKTRRNGRNRPRPAIRAGAVFACAILLAGCSGGGDGGDGGGGGFLGFGGDDGGELVATDIGQGYVDGATTTIVAPPGWDGDAGASGGDDENEKKDDGGGGLFGLGGGSKGDLSQVTEASVSDVCPGSSCTIDSMDIDHPGWGPTRVFTLVEEGGDGILNTALAAVDSTGEVKWTFVGPFSYAEAWGFGTDAPDEAEALYVTYNPGRWDGVIALHPTEDGFRELPDGGGNGGYDDNGPMFLYNAAVGELDDDGVYELLSFENDISGGRSMANAIQYKHFLTWTGDGYEELRPKERLN